MMCVGGIDRDFGFLDLFCRHECSISYSNYARLHALARLDVLWSSCGV
jgi:hypothetical protein